jgi:hypothetical protein
LLGLAAVSVEGDGVDGWDRTGVPEMSNMAGDELIVGVVDWEVLRLVVGETGSVVARVSGVIVDVVIVADAVVVEVVDGNLDGTRKIALATGDVDSGRFLLLFVVRGGRGVVVGAVVEAVGGGVPEVSMEVSVEAKVVTDVDAPADGGASVSVGADAGVGSVVDVGARANVVTGSVEVDVGARANVVTGSVKVDVGARANVVTGSVKVDVGARANVITGSVKVDVGDEADCCSVLMKTRSCRRSLKSGRSLNFL